jgi:hypothetical protein
LRRPAASRSSLAFRRFEVFLGYTEEDPETVVPGPSRVFASGVEQS